MRVPVIVALALGLLFPAAADAGQTPAGYVVAVTLSGKDAAARTAIVREGKELPPKLMMPVFDGDVVFLRDPASHIDVELDGGKTVTVGGDFARFEVKGEISTGDDAWSIFTAIGVVLSGEGDDASENMMSKGDEARLAVPMAVHGPNLISKDRRSLWLAWTGGKAPFTVTAAQGGTETILPSTDEREIDLPVQSGKRLVVTIADADRLKVTVRFRFRDQVPAMPEDLKSAAPGRSTAPLLAATWLASQDEGAWEIEAVQALHAEAPGNPLAGALLTRMMTGWKPR